MKLSLTNQYNILSELLMQRLEKNVHEAQRSVSPSHTAAGKGTGKKTSTTPNSKHGPKSWIRKRLGDDVRP